MAHYEHLSIFKQLFDLSVQVEKAVRHFLRYYKYTLGSKMRGLCYEALGLVAEASAGAAIRQSPAGAGSSGESGRVGAHPCGRNRYPYALGVLREHDVQYGIYALARRGSPIVQRAELLQADYPDG